MECTELSILLELDKLLNNKTASPALMIRAIPNYVSALGKELG